MGGPSRKVSPPISEAKNKEKKRAMMVGTWPRERRRSVEFPPGDLRGELESSLAGSCGVIMSGRRATQKTPRSRNKMTDGGPEQQEASVSAERSWEPPETGGPSGGLSRGRAGGQAGRAPDSQGPGSRWDWERPLSAGGCATNVRIFSASPSPDTPGWRACLEPHPWPLKLMEVPLGGGMQACKHVDGGRSCDGMCSVSVGAGSQTSLTMVNVMLPWYFQLSRTWLVGLESMAP